MQSELISIREFSRRIGVSDVAVHKAIKTGRVTVADRTPKGWPLMAWPDGREEWRQNTSESLRRKEIKLDPVPATVAMVAAPVPATPPPAAAPPPKPAAAPKPAKPIAGASPGSNPRPPAAPKPAPPPSPPPAPPPAPAAAEPPAGQAGPTYAQSRAIREAYQARLAKLDFEERSGRLVPADQVKADAFKAARQVRDAMMNIPDRVAMELANEFDPARIHEKLAAEIRVALESLAGAAE